MYAPFTPPPPLPTRPRLPTLLAAQTPVRPRIRPRIRRQRQVQGRGLRVGRQIRLKLPSAHVPEKLRGRVGVGRNG